MIALIAVLRPWLMWSIPNAACVALRVRLKEMTPYHARGLREPSLAAIFSDLCKQAERRHTFYWGLQRSSASRAHHTREAPLARGTSVLHCTTPALCVSSRDVSMDSGPATVSELPRHSKWVVSTASSSSGRGFRHEEANVRIGGGFLRHLTRSQPSSGCLDLSQRQMMVMSLVQKSSMNARFMADLLAGHQECRFGADVVPDSEQSTTRDLILLYR